MTSMSSGCAATASTRLAPLAPEARLAPLAPLAPKAPLAPLAPKAPLLLLIRDFGNLDHPPFGGGPVGRRHDAMRDERIVEAGERHLFTALERVEECLELRLVWMIADVAAVEHLHRQLAPGVPIQAGQLLRMKLVVENASLAADQMRVEVIRLQAIDHCRAFSNAAILELQNRRRCRRILIRREQRVAALRSVAADLVYVVVHAQQQRVHRMAARGQQSAATQIAL